MSSSSSSFPDRSSWFAGLLMAMVIGAAYFNSLTAPLEFRSDPADSAGVHAAPLTSQPLAFVHAIGGGSVIGHHLFNLSIHLVAALALFGLLRRLFDSPVAPEPLRRSALSLAAGAALLWAAHPLLTASMTDIAQRPTLLGGCATLLSFYALVRAAGPSLTDSRLWLWLSFVAWLAGVAACPALVIVPALLLLFDRAFLAGDLRTAWDRRRGYHATALGLGTGLALLLLTPALPTPPSHTSAWLVLAQHGYASILTLKLTLWPDPLVFDYGAKAIGNIRTILPELTLAFVLTALTVFALVARPIAGFLGAWFLGLLAFATLAGPPATLIAEHRAYLPAIAPLVCLVLLFRMLLGRATPWLAIAVAVLLAVATVHRNHDYRSALALWSDTVEKRPANARAHLHLGLAHAAHHDNPGAIHAFAEAIRLDPNLAAAHLHLSRSLLASRPLLPLQLAQARRHAEAAVRLAPSSPAAQAHLDRVRQLVTSRD